MRHSRRPPWIEISQILYWKQYVEQQVTSVKRLSKCHSDHGELSCHFTAMHEFRFECVFDSVNTDMTQVQAKSSNVAFPGMSEHGSPVDSPSRAQMAGQPHPRLSCAGQRSGLDAFVPLGHPLHDIEDVVAGLGDVLQFDGRRLGGVKAFDRLFQKQPLRLGEL